MPTNPLGQMLQQAPAGAGGWNRNRNVGQAQDALEATIATHNAQPGLQPFPYASGRQNTQAVSDLFNRTLRGRDREGYLTQLHGRGFRPAAQAATGYPPSNLASPTGMDIFRRSLGEHFAPPIQGADRSAVWAGGVNPNTGMAAPELRLNPADALMNVGLTAAHESSHLRQMPMQGGAYRTPRGSTAHEIAPVWGDVAGGALSSFGDYMREQTGQQLSYPQSPNAPYVNTPGEIDARYISMMTPPGQPGLTPPLAGSERQYDPRWMASMAARHGYPNTSMEELLAGPAGQSWLRQSMELSPAEQERRRAAVRQNIQRAVEMPVDRWAGGAFEAQ